MAYSRSYTKSKKSSAAFQAFDSSETIFNGVKPMEDRSDTGSYMLTPPALPRELSTLTNLRSEICGSHNLKCKKYRFREIRSPEPIKSHVRNFYIALDAYLDSPQHAMTASEIIDIVTSRLDASDYLKKIKMKSMIVSAKQLTMQEPEWWNDVPSYRITDIGDVFNYSYVPHIIEEVEDYKKGLIPVKIDKEMLDKFRIVVRDILPERDEFESVHPEEILLEAKASRTVINSSDMSTGDHWLYCANDQTFNNSGIRGKRTVLQVSPSNTRDTIIVDIPTRNSLSYIERNVHRIIQHIGGCAMYDNPDEIRNELLRVSKKYKYFLSRDFSKEGITKPREILRVILEELDLKYPDLQFKKYMGVYNSYELLVDNEWIKMPRGHGLGMANSLTTLMQCAIFNLVLQEMEIGYHESEEDAFSMSYNDDNTTAFSREETLEEFWEVDGEVLEKLSLIRKPEKSFKGVEFATICEEYTGRFGRKESYLRAEVLKTLAMTNIVHAKLYFSSLTCSVNEQYIRYYEKEIFSFWGYEFFPDEKLLPFEFGGWKRSSIGNVNLCLNTDQQKFPLDALYYASKKAKIKLPVKKAVIEKTNYISPIEALYNIQPEWIKESDQHIFNIGPPRKVGNYFTRPSMNGPLATICYQRLAEKRQKTYNAVLNKPRTPFKDLKEIIKLENPTVDFIEFDPGNRQIPFQQSERRHVVNPLFVSGGKRGYLKYYHPQIKNWDDDIIANPIPLILRSNDKMTSDDHHEEFRNSHGLVISERNRRVDESDYDLKSFEMSCYSDEDYRVIEDHYLNPQLVMQVASEQGYNVPIPRRIPDEKKELIKTRDEVLKIRHSRYLTMVDHGIRDFSVMNRIEKLSDEDYFKVMHLIVEKETELLESYLQEDEEPTNEEVEPDPVTEPVEPTDICRYSQSDKYWVYRYDKTVKVDELIIKFDKLVTQFEFICLQLYNREEYARRFAEKNKDFPWLARILGFKLGHRYGVEVPLFLSDQIEPDGSDHSDSDGSHGFGIFGTEDE